MLGSVDKVGRRNAGLLALVVAVTAGLARGQAGPTGDGGAAAIALSPAERAWLDAHPSIRVAPDPGFPPIEFFDDAGGYSGMAADYLRLVEEKLGIRFEIVRLPTWDDVLAAVRAREVDVLGAAAESPQRAEYLRFTTKHIRLPGVILATTSDSGALTLADLHGREVAVGSGYVWQDLLTNDHPEIHLVPARGTGKALEILSFGLVDAMVSDPATATWHIQREALTNLRVAGRTEYHMDLALAVRRDWPELVPILDRALAAITGAEHEAIRQRWIQLGEPSLLARREVWVTAFVVLIAVAALVTAAVAWNRSLRRQVTARTEALRAELASRRLMEAAVTGSTQRVTDVAAQIAASADEQRRTLDEYRVSSTRAAAAVRQIAATIANLVQIVGTVDEVARSTAANATQGDDQLERLGAAMQQMVAGSTDLSESIARINDSTARISFATSAMVRIVDQTNLLSVNSAIEAANAGDAAGGFVVVAEEIRRLAGQTAEATLEIEAIVQGILESVSRGVVQVGRFEEQTNASANEVDEIRRSLGAITVDVASLSERFAQIREMVEEQSTGTDEIRRSIEHIDAGAQQIAGSAAEFTKVTAQLQDVAGHLHEQVSSLAADAPAQESH